jgi:hypothetical protein
MRRSRTLARPIQTCDGFDGAWIASDAGVGWDWGSYSGQGVAWRCGRDAGRCTTRCGDMGGGEGLCSEDGGGEQGMDMCEKRNTGVTLWLEAECGLVRDMAF